MYKSIYLTQVKSLLDKCIYGGGYLSQCSMIIQKHLLLKTGAYLITEIS